MSPTSVTWNRGLLNNCLRNKELRFKHHRVQISTYRPYCKQNVYFDADMNDMTYQLDKLFPTSDISNIVICMSSPGDTKDYSCIAVTNIPDLHLVATTQCFPLFWYEENKTNNQQTLFDIENEDKYVRHDGISDWILKEMRSRYNTKSISKKMIFYYVYGLLHSPDYRTRFAADLKKSLPRIPIVDDVKIFMDFYKAGKALAQLHLNYEEVPPCPDCNVYVSDFVKSDKYTEYDHYRVEKMRFPSKTDKSTIIYNGNVRIDNIPAKAYDYIVNGKSAIEWIMERYAVTQDKASLIVNDPNDWSREHNNPTYIFDLLLSIINLSIQTVDIVNALPKLKFE